MLSDSLPAILKTLPIILIVLVIAGVAFYVNNERAKDRKRTQFALELWERIRGAAKAPTPKPYLRNECVIMESQGDGALFDPHLPVPLKDIDAIGSVILVEWYVKGMTARDDSGRTLGVKGTPLVKGTEGPAEANIYHCTVKVIDVKQYKIVHQLTLSPENTSFKEGESVPLSGLARRVSRRQLTDAFDQLLSLPRIGINDPVLDQSGK